MRTSRTVLLVILTGGWLVASAGAQTRQLVNLRTAVDQQATTFFLQIPAPVKFTPSWDGSRNYILDITGLSSSRSAESRSIESPLVSHYRLLNYEGAGGVPHLRLEIALKMGAVVQPEQDTEGITIQIRKDGLEAAPEAPSPVAPEAPSPVAVAKHGTAIREIQVAKLETSSSLEVQIVGNGALEYRTARATNPERLIVDVLNTANQVQQKSLPVNASPLRDVRVGQWSRTPLITRVVMDLDSRAPYQIRRQPNALVVSLGDFKPEAPVGGIEAKPATTATAESKSENPKPLETVLAPLANAKAEVNRAVPVLPVALESAPQPTMAAAPQVAPAPPAAKNAPVPAPAAAPKTLLAQQTPPPPPPGAPNIQPAPAAGGPSYTGEPISVNLKDVDLKDFFRLIHEISGLNIVLDPNVSGTVTLVLDDVPWDQAMEIVLRNNGLDKEVEGNVVRIAKLDTLEAEKKQQTDLAVAAQKAQPIVTVTRTLNYANAVAMTPILKKFLISDRGDVVPDLRTNTLLITDIPGGIERVDGLIRTLDRKSQQVEIEVRVVSASRSFARDIGSQLAASGLTGNVILGGAGAVGTSPITRGTVPPLFVGTPPTGTGFANVAMPLLTNLPAAGATSGASLLLTSGSNFALDAILTAAETKGISKLLSRPKIITQNNVEATVKQGVSIPLQTTVNNTVSVQYIDVVLRLTVTPQITSEGTIFLKTDIEDSNIDPGIATVPGQFGLDTEGVTTSVLVSNGGTVFFGGVVQTTNRVNVNQVPLLGSIPLIGNLFKEKATSSTTNELLFFITPRIVQS